MLPFINRHADKILGVISCFDRIIVTGTFPQICHTRAMASFLTAADIRLFDYPLWAEPLREMIRTNAERIAAAEGITIEFISRSKERRKEDIIREVLAKRGSHTPRQAAKSGAFFTPATQPPLRVGSTLATCLAASLATTRATCHTPQPSGAHTATGRKSGAFFTPGDGYPATTSCWLKTTAAPNPNPQPQHHQRANPRTYRYRPQNRRVFHPWRRVPSHHSVLAENHSSALVTCLAASPATTCATPHNHNTTAMPTRAHTATSRKSGALFTTGDGSTPFGPAPTRLWTRSKHHARKVTDVYKRCKYSNLQLQPDSRHPTNIPPTESC